MDFQQLLCDLGRCDPTKKFECATKYVIVERDALSALDRICEDYHHILMVSDQNTYGVCGKNVAQILGKRVADSVMFQTGSAPLVPDETAIAAIREKMSDCVDLVLGVGSGVINDLCKIVSFERGIPYYIVATAPSMDGYASSGSALILKGMKVTLNATPPKAIVADTTVLKDAPMEMLQAGYGDIIGKYSCLNDWKLSALLRDEYFCPGVFDIVYGATEGIRAIAKKIIMRDEEAIGALMEALVTVGIAMAYVGNSRPASGSEHHLSHYFEITGIVTGTPYLAHGIDVVYSAVLTAQLREQIIASAPRKCEFDEETWKTEMKRIYRSSAEEVIALQKKMGWYWQDDSRSVLSKIDAIRVTLSEVPTKTQMLQMLEAVGLDYQAFLDFYGKKKIEDGILYAKDLKDRYTVLWLYYEFFRQEG